MTTNGIYIYGIVPNFYGTTQFQSLANSGVYAITFENISAIVSDKDLVHLDSLDRESLGHLLVHHQEVIEKLQGKGFTMIIPMQLGTIAASREEVIKILVNGHDLIIDTLKKIEYLTEIDLVVMWPDFAGVLKGIASLPEVKEMKEEMENNPIITKVDQYKMGLFIQQKLETKNKDIEINILNGLSQFGLDIKMHAVMNDEMVLNAAFLINRNKQDKFENAIDKLDEEYKGTLNFKLVGPLPCYSFYTLEVKIMDPGLVEKARIELGLKEKTTETEIKKAYLEKAKQFHPDNSHNDDDAQGFNRILNAYHTLLDYAASARQSSKDEMISLVKERVTENLTLVKIKE